MVIYLVIVFIQLFCTLLYMEFSLSGQLSHIQNNDTETYIDYENSALA